jgi:pimeloyl-ACP methyl ester carboxylesterase
MKTKLNLVALMCCLPMLLFAQKITGSWNGLLEIPGGHLRIVFRITADGAGYTTLMDSPDQGVKGIPVTSTVFADSVLKLDMPAAKISYSGKLGADMHFQGTFTQGPKVLPLNLSREQQALPVIHRMQDPVEPYPYYTEEVKFTNARAQVTLAGTLSLPKKEGHFPVVVLITGSGAQNRNEELLGHKPFLILSDFLCRQGIAVLRFDDRGTGESTGDYSLATTADLSWDVEAGLNYLKTRPEINTKQIGLIGHSEGGIIAPMIAARNKDIAFVVLMAGTGIPGGDLLLLQKELISRAAGVSEVDINSDRELSKGAFDIVRNAKPDADLKTELNTYFSQKLKEKPELKPAGISADDFVALATNSLSGVWMRYFISYNPYTQFKDVHCPVLALNGEKDLQVPAKVNLQAIQIGLREGGNKQVKAIELPGLNHLFQECVTGSPSEYAKIEQTMSPVALKSMGDWIKQRTK